MTDEPSLRELKSLIERNHADTREDYVDLKAQFGRDLANVLQQMQQFVLREVFDAKESAMLQRIGALEEAAKTARSQVRAAVLAAAGSVVATILTAIILAVIFKGGKP